MVVTRQRCRPINTLEAAPLAHWASLRRMWVGRVSMRLESYMYAVMTHSSMVLNGTLQSYRLHS
jgi:hypothetical protein